MPTTIVIDGYNLIRQSPTLIDFEAISLEEGRSALIRLLVSYRQAKGHAITVVFYGWISDNIGQSRERVGGVDVIYSGRGEKADDVIKNIVNDMRDRVVVVTSDRDIAVHSSKKGAVVIASPEFEMKVRMNGCENEGDELDFQKESGRGGTKKKGPARRLSKEERKRRDKMRKL